jgi:hypothetical protein
MGASWRILKAEATNFVTEFTQGGRCGSAREARTNDNKRMAALVGGIN